VSEDVVKLKGLLFSSDAQVLSVMNQVLDNFEIETEVCIELSSALDAVTNTKLDTLIMDWTGSDDSIQILNAMRNSAQNAKSTALAMVNGDLEVQSATKAGANFIIYKPVNVDQATRFLRASYGNMLMQRRRAVRCSVDIPVTADVIGTGPVEGKIVYLSVRGLAFQCRHAMQVDQHLAIAFKLPGTSALIHVSGKVVNVATPDDQTRAGVSFSSVPPKEFTVLEQWMSNHSPKLPSQLIAPDNRPTAR